MTELLINCQEKANDNKNDLFCDSYNDVKPSLDLSLNENATEAKTMKSVEVDNGVLLYLNQMKSCGKPESQVEIREVWDKSYNLLSKLTSEELIKLYFNLTVSQDKAAIKVPLINNNSSNSTVSSLTGINATFNFESANQTQETGNHCCTCKHSNCLKLYCACIRQKGYCGNNCKCKECYNTKEFEEIRNKSIQLLEKKRERAFKSVIVELDDGSKVHAYGCRCHNSNCEKNYCQCFRNKVKCTLNCKCNGCSNCK